MCRHDSPENGESSCGGVRFGERAEPDADGEPEATRRGGLYPSHTKFAASQRTQKGLLSSHFIRRFRQVAQPVRTRLSISNVAVCVVR